MMNIDIFIGTEMTGNEFNQRFDHLNFVKLTNEKENHYGFQFNDGLNVDHNSFDPSGSCQKGGIYFTTYDNAYMWAYCNDIMMYVRKVIIPNDARVYIEDKKCKVDKIFLCPKDYVEKKIYVDCIKLYYDMTDHDYIPSQLFRDRDIYMKIIEYDCNMFAFVPTFLKDRDMCMEAVRHNGNMLKYVPTILKDRDMCTEATRQNTTILFFVPEYLRDYEMCLEAVKDNGTFLICVPEYLKDRNMCIEAVKENSKALDYVPMSLRSQIKSYVKNK